MTSLTPSPFSPSTVASNPDQPPDHVPPYQEPSNICKWRWDWNGLLRNPK
ncbi:hypothetical protein BGY98DRAFT_1039731 [Russula aff. rugulosa BPL654]|nr:hypothetical protein BGY98DRAFT_1039731 [Russula aff. rugulosa BPL654]